MIKMLRFLVILTCFTVTACATIFSGDTQTLTFNSNPEGAQILIDGEIIGVTPITINVDKGNDKLLTFSKEGYQDYSIVMKTGINGWFFGNLIIGGAFGMTTDTMSGSAYEYATDSYMVNLRKIGEKALSPVLATEAYQVKTLVTGFGSEIRHQIIEGDGEELDALYTLVNPDDYDEFIETLNSLALKHSDNVAFADAIIKYYSLK